VKLDPKKIESIKEWKSPVSTKRVSSFLGLANFYKFIKDFSTLARLFIHLLKKRFVRMERQRRKCIRLLKGEVVVSIVILGFCKAF
jgi:hypothetical protein